MSKGLSGAGHQNRGCRPGNSICRSAEVGVPSTSGEWGEDAACVVGRGVAAAAVTRLQYQAEGSSFIVKQDRTLCCGVTLCWGKPFAAPGVGGGCGEERLEPGRGRGTPFTKPRPPTACPVPAPGLCLAQSNP